MKTKKGNPFLINEMLWFVYVIVIDLSICFSASIADDKLPVENVGEDKAMLKIYDDQFFRQLTPALGRGINLGNALEAPKEGDWGFTLKEEYFDKIAAAGLNNVRIPVRWTTHAEADSPYRIDPKFFERVDWAVNQALKRHLIPVLNMHHYDEIFKEPEKHSERFVALWRQIAEHYKDFPPELILELLNEPHDKLTAEKWNRLLKDTLAEVRKSNSTREIMIGPAD